MDSTTPAGNAAAPESHIDDSSAILLALVLLLLLYLFFHHWTMSPPPCLLVFVLIQKCYYPMYELILKIVVTTSLSKRVPVSNGNWGIVNNWGQEGIQFKGLVY